MTDTNNPQSEISAEEYNALGPFSRAAWRRNRVRAADLSYPSGPIGVVILRLRLRAEQASRSALWFLIGLFITIVVGLAYYIGDPVLRRLTDGRRLAHLETIELTIEGSENLDSQRKNIRDRMVDALKHAGTRVPWPEGQNPEGLEMLPDNRTLIAYDTAGNLLRSSDGGVSWTAQELQVMEGLVDLKVLSDGRTILAFGWSGTISRSIDSGKTWKDLNVEAMTDFRDVIVLPEDQGLIAFGYGDTIFRGTERGAHWVSVNMQVDIQLRGLEVLPDGRTLFAYGSNGSIFRSDDAGRTWSSSLTPMAGFDVYALKASPDGQTLFAWAGSMQQRALWGSSDGGTTWTTLDLPPRYGLDGMAVLSDGKTGITWGSMGISIQSWQDDRNWTTRFPVTEENVEIVGVDFRQEGKILIAYGWPGALFRSDAKGEEWEKLETGTREALRGFMALNEGQIQIAYGSRGTITRSEDGGNSWKAMKTGTEQDLLGLDVLPGNQGLVAYGRGGTLVHSDDDGATWTSWPSGTDGDLRFLKADQVGRTLVALVAGPEGSTLVQISDELAIKLEQLELPPGKLGDEKLQQFWLGLPIPVFEFGPIVAFDRELQFIVTRRQSIIETRTTSEDALSKISTGSIVYEEQLKAFEAFMKSCQRGASDKSEIVEVCTKAWTADQAANADAWWEKLSGTVPQGILLLFLLATLGALYRYNLRLAGFHDSRADALELFCDTRSEVEIDKLAKLADIIAADKVAFDKGELPSNQMKDIVNSLVQKIP